MTDEAILWARLVSYVGPLREASSQLDNKRKMIMDADAELIIRDFLRDYLSDYQKTLRRG